MDERQTCEKISSRNFGSSNTKSDRTDELVFARFFRAACSEKKGRRARRWKPPKGSWQCNIKCFAVWSHPKQTTRICWTCVAFFGSKITSARSNCFYGGLELPFRIPFASSEAIFWSLASTGELISSFSLDALSFASTIFILRLFLMSFLCAQKALWRSLNWVRLNWWLMLWRDKSCVHYSIGMRIFVKIFQIRRINCAT